MLGWVQTYIINTCVWVGFFAPLLIVMGYCAADFTKALGDRDKIPVAPKYFKSTYFWATVFITCVLDGAVMAILNTTIKNFHPPTFLLFNVVLGVLFVKMLAQYKQDKKFDE